MKRNKGLSNNTLEKGGPIDRAYYVILPVGLQRGLSSIWHLARLKLPRTE
jgi:hypothetical protein